jgi:hypothetical protein
MGPPFVTLTPSHYGTALIAAGLAVGIAAAVLVGVFVWGGWPATLYPAIIEILGKALIGAGTIMALVIVILGIGGPIKNAKVGGKVFNIEVEGD